MPSRAVVSSVAAGDPPERGPAFPLLVRAASLTVFAALPAVAVAYVFIKVLVGELDVYAVHAYVGGAEAILRGDSPYPGLDDPELARGAGFVYPPLTAIVAAPLTLPSIEVAEIIVMALFVLLVGATLAALGVRDWRCYGLVFLWPPVLNAIQVGNVSLLMALGAALVWRFRDAPRAAGLSLGATLVTKLFLWPLAVWLVVTARFRAALWSVGVAASVLTASWAVIGFAGLTGYPALLSRLSDLMDEWGYSIFAIGIDLGMGQELAKALWISLAAAVLAGVVVLGRRGDDRGAFILAVAAAIAFSPIVWLHYLSLLIVPVALTTPRLGPIWFIPVSMWLTTGGDLFPAIGNGSTAQTAATLGVAAVTVAVTLGLSAPRLRRAPPSALSTSLSEKST